MLVHADVDGEYEEFLSFVSEEPEDERSNEHTGLPRTIVLSAGGDLPDDDDGALFRFQSGTHGRTRFQRTICPDWNTAIAYFLGLAETHNAAEEDTLAQLAACEEHYGVPFEAYIEWLDGLTERDRRIRLMDFLEWRVEHGGDFAAEPYLDAGTWRSTALPERDERLARQLYNRSDGHPRLCYRTAQTAVIAAMDDPAIDDSRIQYAEGVVLAKHPGQAISHAWVEIDGEVAELTWPWHRPTGGDGHRRATYFGVAVDNEEMRETFEGRGGGTQVFLDDETARKVADVRKHGRTG